MKLLNPRNHSYIDYLTVSTFMSAPNFFGFVTLAAVISYILGTCHLIMSLITDYPGGMIKSLSFPVHGTVELLTSAALVAIPWVFGLTSKKEKSFFIGAGIFYLGSWLITDYKAATGNRKTKEIIHPEVEVNLAEYYKEMSAISGSENKNLITKFKNLMHLNAV